MSIKSVLRRAKNWIVGAIAAAAAAVAAFFGADAVSQSTSIVDRLSWEAPTQFEGGGAIPAGTITGYRLAWDGSETGTFTAGTTVGNVLNTTVTRTGETSGNRCYRVAAMVGDATGMWSATACKRVMPPVAAPGNVRVE